jgi:predicted patatin/cPLA2 family phospholipase
MPTIAGDLITTAEGLITDSTDVSDARMRIILQNGNDGTHYPSEENEGNLKNDFFDKVITDTLTDLKQLLIVKGKEYRRNNNVYHNFDQGAKIKSITPEKALDGFLLKHEISIADMTNDLDKGILPIKEKVEEKFNDNIIYLLIKKAMILNRINNK